MKEQEKEVNKQVRLNPVVNDKLEKIVEARELNGQSCSKTSVIAELVIAQHKKECK